MKPAADPAPAGLRCAPRRDILSGSDSRVNLRFAVSQGMCAATNVPQGGFPAARLPRRLKPLRNLLSLQLHAREIRGSLPPALFRCLNRLQHLAISGGGLSWAPGVPRSMADSKIAPVATPACLAPTSPPGQPLGAPGTGSTPSLTDHACAAVPLVPSPCSQVPPACRGGPPAHRAAQPGAAWSLH